MGKVQTQTNHLPTPANSDSVPLSTTVAIMPEQTPEKQQKFYPITHLPMFRNIVDEQLKHYRVQFAQLKQAEGEAAILDDATVNRVIEVYSESEEGFDCFRRQLNKWQSDKIAPEQALEISGFETQLEKLVQCQNEIMTLAHKLKEGTIEQVLGKSDIELGMDFLSEMMGQER